MAERRGGALRMQARPVTVTGRAQICTAASWANGRAALRVAASADVEGDLRNRVTGAARCAQVNLDRGGAVVAEIAPPRRIVLGEYEVRVLVEQAVD